MSSDPRYVVAVDQGTTSTRSIVFDLQGRMVSLASRQHRHHHPQPGWSEHDPAEIWRHVQHVVPQALDDIGADASQVVALGIANQRESCLVWERRTGRPLTPVITWEDTRAGDVVQQVLDAGHGDLVVERTGAPVSTYFAGSRLRWLLDHVRGLAERAERGEVCFGTMETWLVWNLTGGADGGRHVTDVTNASRTNLLDVRGLDWDPRMLEVFGVPHAMLPHVEPTTGDFGTCTSVLPGVPVAAAMGDQQAALFGQTCFAPGQSKATFGTGAFLLVNAGSEVPPSGHGLVPTVAYVLPGEAPVYALEGSVAAAGSLVQWCRDALRLVPTAPRIETLARTAPDNGGCYVVPAFSGLYAPRWDAHARGVIVGLTAYVDRGHLARGVLEATAWQTAEVVEAVASALGHGLDALRVDGGMTTNHLLMQTVADVLDVPVERPLFAETVSVGAAYAAGLGVGAWGDLDALSRLWRRAARWEPAMPDAVRRRERAQWSRAVERAQHWVELPEGPDQLLLSAPEPPPVPEDRP
ncbi:glycerol kinase GlpK [Lapillicoccus jejuensis]|uniref:glycerol kinase n=1 Tax=Lapillicoccus jejuensis TaxID=402171 RepID=A0A542DYF8_9MICO|nr:glycerol kinase GlpK [Lapillicoccus jejuensis]TQJ08133.1 glycerol kinase [Lapillicoccus jejuensis]